MTDAGGEGRERPPPPARPEPPWLRRVRMAARLDLRPGPPPSNVRWALATLAAVAGSLALNALAVHVATTEYPSTRHFSHFRFADYGTLTVVGVLFAAGGWAALVRLSSEARSLCFRLSIALTLVLWLPDVLILVQGETDKGVATLMVMHLVVVLVAYNLLVRVAPGGSQPLRRAAAEGGDGAPALCLSERLVRRIWGAVGLLVVLDLVLGVIVIVAVPFRRPAGLLPPRGEWIYVAHGAVGIVLGLAALAVLVLSTVAGRVGRIGAVVGAIGVGVGLVGGVCSSFQTTRLLGMAVMLVGVIVAGVGYMAPLLEAIGKAEVAKAAAARAALAARGETHAPMAPPGRGAVTDDVVSSNGHGASPRGG